MENTTLIIAGLMVLAIVFLMAMFAKLFRKAGPHEAIIVYGFRGTRVVKGRGTVIFPMVESCRGLSLELMSFDVAPKQDLYTRQGVAVTVEAVAQIKVKSDPESTLTAAEAERDTAIRRAEASREAAIAKAKADQERVLAETLSQAKQAEAQRDLDVKKAEYLELVKRQQAQADKVYEIQTNVMQQKVRAEEVIIHQVEKEHEVLVQDAEIQRRDRELTATVLKQAEYERRRIETLAEAEKRRLVMEAEGKAAAIRAQGEAEAEIIFKKGEAEAKAMNVKAEAYQEFNQAAIVDKLITGMPEVVRALASPLANVDKITIVSTGNGDAAGMNKITGDITKMAAQVPALFETLSGMPLNELFAKVRLIGDKAPKPDANSKAAGK
jgi:flotillin